MARPILYLFVGYPGAGKTTIAKLIAARTGAVHLWADKQRKQMFGQPQHTPAENKKLYNQMNQQAGRLLHEGRSVIFDTNFNFHKDRQHLRQIAEQNGADYLVIWVSTPKEVAKQRAVHQGSPSPTRIFGQMSESDFERIASHLEPPSNDEKVIKIDGTKLDGAAITELLGIA